MTSDSARVVPQEIAERIIDCIHDDPPALRSCALVCHSWLKHSRSHLFRRIAVSFDSHGSSNLYHATLPVMGEFGKEIHWRNVLDPPSCSLESMDVINLVYEISPIIPARNHRFSIDFTIGIESLAMVKKTLYAVPDFTRCVREVEWTFRTDGDLASDWQLTQSLFRCFPSVSTVAFEQAKDYKASWPSHLIGLLPQWLPTATITSLHIRNIFLNDDNEFFTFIAAFPGLLELEAVDLRLGTAGADANRYTAPQLKSLTLGLEGDRFARQSVLSWLMVQHAPPTLEALHISSGCSRFEPLALELLQKCGSGLREASFHGEFSQ
jgi:hypothetical protein